MAGPEGALRGTRTVDVDACLGHAGVWPEAWQSLSTMLHQSAARQLAGRERRVHVGDRRLEQAEALRTGEVRGQQSGRDQGRRPEARGARAFLPALADCRHASLHASSRSRRVRAVQNPRRRDGLPGVPRAVLGGLEDQAQGGARQARPAHPLRNQQVLARGGSQLVQRALDLRAGASGDLTQGAGRRAGLAFGARRGLLGIGEHLAPRVGQQAIERPTIVRTSALQIILPSWDPGTPHAAARSNSADCRLSSRGFAPPGSAVGLPRWQRPKLPRRRLPCGCGVRDPPAHLLGARVGGMSRRRDTGR